jgi:enamine deaminase RidA (YjgF/YER057c/UK114 family)
VKGIEILQPQGWMAPRGYSNGVTARGRQIFVAGQIGWNGQGQIVSDRLSEQVRQALENIVTVLTTGGAQPSHLVRLTWYVTNRDEYLGEAKEIGAAYRAVIGRHFPAMSVLQVSALAEARAKVEIEATAVVPDVA